MNKQISINTVLWLIGLGTCLMAVSTGQYALAFVGALFFSMAYEN